MKSKKLRDSARGQDCTFQIVGVCNCDPSTTVLCHLPDESSGVGKKADDFSAAFGCSACHDVVDGRAKDLFGEYRGNELFYNHRAMKRTWRKWIDMGLIMIKGAQ